MARIINILNEEHYRYINDNFRALEGLNEIDYSVASYLFHLEAIRSTKKSINLNEEKDYIHPAVMTIARECGIKSRTTVVKSLKKLKEKGVVSIETTGNAYEANRYYINKEYMNETPIDEQIEGDETFNRLMSMMLELRSELRAVRKENSELLNEVKALHKRIENLTNPIEEETEPIEEAVVEEVEQEEAVECRNMPTISVKTPTMSVRMSKVLANYDTLYGSIKKPSTPKNEPIEEPIEVIEPIEVVESRSMAEPKKYDESKLRNSFIKFGYNLCTLSSIDLMNEFNYRIKNNIDFNFVIDEIGRRHKRYEADPHTKDEEFYRCFTQDILSLVG